MKLTDVQPGQRVTFCRVPGYVGHGTVTSVGRKWVFVRYDGSLSDAGQATDPADLTLVTIGVAP